jgi:hypothetical protein
VCCVKASFLYGQATTAHITQASKKNLNKTLGRAGIRWSLEVWGNSTIMIKESEKKGKGVLRIP